MDRVVRARPGAAALRARAARVTLVLADCDGVLTDAGVYYSAHGEVLKRFSTRDGMAVQLLRTHGVETGIITGERSAALVARAHKLGLEHLFLGVVDKQAHLGRVLEQTGRSELEVAFIGDDLNDLGLIERLGILGLTGAPADAVAAVRRAVHHRGRVPGGHGAFREFADWILTLRGATAGGTTIASPSGEVHG